MVVKVSIAVVNSKDKSNLRRNQFLSSYNFYITFHHWGKSRQEPEGKNWSRSCGGVLPTVSLLVAGSAYFLIQLRTTCPLTAVGWTLLHQSSVKNITPRLLYSSVWWGYFLFSGSLFLDVSRLCQAEQKKEKRETAQRESGKMYRS